MTSKVLVKLPMVPFPQEKKPPSELVTLPERNDGTSQMRQGMNVDRAAQLEQNMKFLQEQHQATLVTLHQEVDLLRQRNRDLQFQLVFSKGTSCLSSSPSSPEDNGNGFVKPKGSPACISVPPLQVELLEKELQDVKTSLQEAKAHNQYLSKIVEQQKKTLESTEEQKDKVAVTDVGIQVGGRLDPTQVELIARLEDAEAMVKRLHRESVDQKKEIATLKAASVNSGGTARGGRSRDSNNSHHSRGSPIGTAQEQTTHKFPPLQTQSYWHRRLPRNGRNRHDKQDAHVEADTSTVLPQLQNGSVKSDTVVFESPFYRSRGYHNYYREGGNRKYRGQISQRDRRESEQRYNHRRDYKERGSKDQPKDFVDSAEGSRDTDSSRRQ